MTLYVAPLKQLVRHSWHGRPISWRNSCCHSSGPLNCSSAVPFFPHGQQGLYEPQRVVEVLPDNLRAGARSCGFPDVGILLCVPGLHGSLAGLDQLVFNVPVVDHLHPIGEQREVLRRHFDPLEQAFDPVG